MSFVNLMLWLTVIAVLIRLSKDYNLLQEPEYIIICFGSLLILYIAGAMWTNGSTSEIMNEYIRDDADRNDLNMVPYELRDRVFKRSWSEWLFLIAGIGLLTLFVLS